MHLRILCLIAAMASSILVYSQQELVAQRKMVIMNGTVFTGALDDTPAMKNIYVCNGLITAVELAKSPVRSDYMDAQVVDAKGKFVMPGFVDSHVHLITHQGEVLESVQKPLYSILRRELLSGVTTIRDMGGDGLLIGVFARSANRDSILSPDIFYSAFLAGRQYYNLYGLRDENSKEYFPNENLPWNQTIYDTTDIKRVITLAKGSGATGIKIYSDVPINIMKDLVTEAHSQGMETWSHATVLPSLPIDAIDAGVKVISHSYLIPFQQLSGKKEISFDYETMMTLKRDFPELKTIFDKMKSRGTILDATIFLSSIGDSISRELTYYTTKMAHSAGVKVSAGTDWMYDDKEDRCNMYDEIILFVKECGFTPKEALNAATVVSAETIGLKDRGVLEVGKRADIVLLDKSPIDDIDNVKMVSCVIKNGILYSR